jgi:hypothetical protein
MEIRARLLNDPAEIKSRLGGDAPTNLVVLETQAALLEEGKFTLDLEDFLLVSGRDGQKSTHVRPDQLASANVLIVSQTSSGGAHAGPVVGNRIPGIGSPPPSGIGSGGPGLDGIKTEEKRVKQKTDLLQKLREQQMPIEVTATGVKGLLYFLVEGKWKPKDLTLLYRGKDGRITLDFGELRSK